jgi:D-3-phosphoglycerate dehydrogenase
MPVEHFRTAFAPLEAHHEIAYLQVDPEREFKSTESAARLTEYQGSPAELAEHMAGVEVLVVQGAPVTQEVAEASSALKLVGCARGGPVNVDVAALTQLGLPLVNTPGKNADAVADLTVAFLVMLARGLPKAQRFLEAGHQLKDNWEGAKFMGSDLRGHVLGLVGYGRVARLVARRAASFGMGIVTYDPYVTVEDENVRQAESLDELLATADFVSLHMRASADTANLFDAETFSRMRRGAFLVNTARESLIDEDALDAVLADGWLAGAALDVIRTTPEEDRHRLLRHENVIMTPHLGGATTETLARGAEMLAAEIQRLADGRSLINVVNSGVFSS